MTKVVVRNFSVSIDGYGAGPSQDLTHPLGVAGPELFDWFFHTRTFNQMQGNAAGETGVDDDLSAQSMIGMGAWIMGRNMFGPIRGPWADDSWKGWWGDEPPYHAPVFVLTHHARAPLSPLFGNISAPVWSTSCTWRCRPSCLAKAKTCWKVSICVRSDTSA